MEKRFTKLYSRVVISFAAVMLSVVLLVGSIALFSRADSGTHWSGGYSQDWIDRYEPIYTQTVVFDVASAEELAAFSHLAATHDFSNKTVVLANDVTLNDTSDWISWNGSTVGLNAWTPIGSASVPFKGLFDGRKHIINGIFINNPSADYQGLFGYLGLGGIVRNVTVSSGFIQGRGFVGGVAGYAVADALVDGGVNGATVKGGTGAQGNAGAGGPITPGMGAGIAGGTGGTGGAGGDVCVGGILGLGNAYNCYNFGEIIGGTGGNGGGGGGGGGGAIDQPNRRVGYAGSGTTGGRGGNGASNETWASHGTGGRGGNGGNGGHSITGGIVGLGNVYNSFSTGKVSGGNGGTAGGGGGGGGSGGGGSGAFHAGNTPGAGGVGGIPGSSWTGGITGSGDSYNSYFRHDTDNDLTAGLANGGKGANGAGGSAGSGYYNGVAGYAGSTNAANGSALIGAVAGNSSSTAYSYFSQGGAVSAAVGNITAADNFAVAADGSIDGGTPFGVTALAGALNSWVSTPTVTVPISVVFYGWNTEPFPTLSVDNSFTITFITYGGTVPYVRLFGGDDVSLFEPDAPTREVSVFSGWYKENTFENLFDFDVEPNPVSYLALYAKWTSPLASVAESLRTGTHAYHQAVADVFLTYWENTYMPIFSADAPTAAQLTTVTTYAQSILERDVTHIIIAEGMEEGDNQGYANALVDMFLEYMETKYMPVFNAASPTVQQIDAVVAAAQSILARDDTVLERYDEFKLGIAGEYSQSTVTEFLNYIDNTYMPIFNNLQATQAQINAINTYAQSILDRTPAALREPTAFMQAESGENHTVALDREGFVWTWGKNDVGQLGDSTGEDSQVPIRLEKSAFGDKKITAISAGGNHNLAIDEDGKLWAWGSNSGGQIGDGVGFHVYEPKCIDVFGGDVAQIAAGGAHSMAIANGFVWAWGLNGNGQLGDGTTTNSNVPVMIAAERFQGTQAASISAGASHSAAVTRLGTLFTWGLNTNGQLGNGTTTQSSIPVGIDKATVFSGKSIKSVSAGTAHTLALTTGGEIYSFGLNTSGRLGDGTTVQRTTPVLITSTRFGGKMISQITAGGTHSSAIDIDGHLWSWGNNSAGQLGDNSIAVRLSPVPAKLTNSSGDKAIWVSAGAGHTAVADETGRVWTFGLNTNGQLGDSGTANRSVPTLAIDVQVVAVLDLTAAKVLVAQAEGDLSGYTLVSAAAFRDYVNSAIVNMIASVERGEEWTQGGIDELVEGAPALEEYEVPDLTAAKALVSLLSGNLEETYTADSVTAFRNYVSTEIEGMIVSVESRERDWTQEEVDAKAEAAPILMAKPPLSTWTITLNVNGDETRKIVWTNNQPIPAAPANPELLNHTFADWYDNSGFTGEPIVWNTFVLGLTSDATIYAKFIPYIKISFDTNGARAGIAPIVIEPADTDLYGKEPIKPIKEGNVFGGWFKEDSFATEFVFNNEEIPDTDITLYAKWTREQYVVVYDFNGGTADAETGTVTFGDLYNFKTPRRANYEFVGWFGADEMNGSKQYTDDRGMGPIDKVWSLDVGANGASVTLTAVWKKARLEVRFYVDGNYTTIFCTFDELIPLSSVPANPKKDFAVFTGWLRAEDSMKFDVENDKVMEHLNLIAGWEADPSKLSNLVSSLQDFVGFEGFEAADYERFVDAMDGAADILRSPVQTILGVKASYEALLNAAQNMSLIKDGTEDEIIPPSEFRPSVQPANDTLPFILLGVAVISAAVAVTVLVVMRKRKTAAM